jgi:quinol monooxygenase YgiN
MATQDKCCTIVPYFKVHSGKTESFHALCGRFVEATSKEPKCLYYGFSFEGDVAHCREGYENAEAALAHLENVGPLIQEVLKIADLTRIEEPMAELDPQFFTLEYGFRR